MRLEFKRDRKTGYWFANASWQEGDTTELQFQLRDEYDQIISKGALTGLSLTLVERSTGHVINGRHNQDVFDDNNVTVSPTGVVKWDAQSEDFAIMLDIALGDAEEHLATFQIRWGVDRVNTETFVFTVISTLKAVTAEA